MALIALHSAATGLSALSTALDVTANNLANVNTVGYKGSRANFQDLLYIEKAQPGALNANGDARPTGLYVGLGTKISGTQLNFESGSALNTGFQLDLMIDGDGLFVLEVDDEIGGGLAYTRAGNFTLNADGEMVLANDQGRRLVPNITIDPSATNVTISKDGVISIGLPGETEPQEVGTIELAKFVNPAGLQQIGENIFVQTAASGEPATGNPRTEGRGAILQGFLEGANVDPVRELVELIKTQRAFELNSQSIQAADEVLQNVGNLRRF